MSDALTIAIQSMQNDLQRMDIISQNVVNSATPGYRRALPVSQDFSTVLQNSAIPGEEHSLAISLPTVASVLDATAGAMKSTGQPLDLAINGDGYFELTTPDGIAYTRAGNFHLDAGGRLVSQDGFAVNGRAGDIVTNGKTPIIAPDGTVTDGLNTVGQIRIVRFPNKARMETRGNGLLAPTDKNAETDESNAQLQVGYLENANVVPLNEMVNMMETSRHFESQQKLFQGYDEQISTAIQKLGQF
ncbi:MAG TPA: flagellar hook basal-body protein [Burkholderiaceae bacterium]